MDRAHSQYHLKDNAEINHIQRDENDMLLSFDVIVPPSKIQPQGSKLHFDFNNYSRENENTASNKELRETILATSRFLAENVPAYTTLAASVVESGAREFVLKNPDAARFGLAKFPGITTNEEIDAKKQVVFVGNLDKVTEYSQIGYESHPKAYLDSEGKKHDLRPAIMMLHQLAMASKDLQEWPLPLTFDGNEFGRSETIGNTMKASFFVRDVVNLKEDKPLTIDHLRQGYVPDALLAKGYPEPVAVSAEHHKRIKQRFDDALVTDKPDSVIHADAIIRNRILANLIKEPEFQAQLNSDDINTRNLAL